MRPRKSSSSCRGLQKYKETDHKSPAARSPGLFDMLPKPAEDSVVTHVRVVFVYSAPNAQDTQC